VLVPIRLAGTIVPFLTSAAKQSSSVGTAVPAAQNFLQLLLDDLLAARLFDQANFL